MHRAVRHPPCPVRQAVWQMRGEGRDFHYLERRLEACRAWEISCAGYGGRSRSLPDPTQLQGGERLFEVGDQIVGCLNADGQPDEVARHDAVGALHRFAVLGETLHPAQGRGGDENFQRRRDAPGGFLVAPDLDRHHAAEAAGHLTAGDVMAGVALQAGIKDAFELRVVFEMPGQDHGVGGTLRKAQIERSHAAQQKPGLEGGDDRAKRDAQRAYFLPAFIDPGGGQNAGGDIAVTV